MLSVGGILAKCKEISRFARNVWYRADLANVTWNVRYSGGPSAR